MTAFLVGLALALTCAVGFMALICKLITARPSDEAHELARYRMDELRCPRCGRVDGKGGHVCDASPLPPPPPVAVEVNR